jgi:Ca-activated chloride channel family protein
VQCGGELAYETEPPPEARGSYVQAQMELDQVRVAAGRNAERYVLVTLRTPAQVPAGEAPPTATGRPPLSFTAVLDISGSMHGDKLAQAKEAVRQALCRLHDGDSFALITFSNDVSCIFKPARVNDHTRRVVESALKEIQAGGMTALCGGLDLGLKKARAMKQETNLVLLLSDGQANVGETDVELVGKRGYEARRQGIIVSTLGVGSDYNEALMVEIATQGGGRFYHVKGAGQISAYLTGELGEVAALAARDAALHLSLPAGAAVMPLSAAYPARQEGEQAIITLGDLPSDIELEVPIRLTLPAQPAGAKLSIDGSLTYQSPAGNPFTTPLNRVTLRFVEQAAFEPRDGVVVPVVTRVLEQMRAASVLGISRAMAKGPAEARQQADRERSTVQQYASLLGEEKAEETLGVMDATFSVMQSAPGEAKKVVAAAFSRQRSTKTFDKDDA